MKMYAVVIAACLACTSAYATMPMLTPKPTNLTQGECNTWAANQVEDAVFMWGLQSNGESSRKVALKRLTDSCMGRPIPDIVGFGSSAGFDDTYCKKHRAEKICHLTSLPQHE